MNEFIELKKELERRNETNLLTRSFVLLTAEKSFQSNPVANPVLIARGNWQEELSTAPERTGE